MIQARPAVNLLPVRAATMAAAINTAIAATLATIQFRTKAMSIAIARPKLAINGTAQPASPGSFASRRVGTSAPGLIMAS